MPGGCPGLMSRCEAGSPESGGRDTARAGKSDKRVTYVR